MSAWSVQAASIAHAPLLAALHAAAFDPGWSPSAMQELLAMPGAFALVAETEGEPEGFILCRAAGGECEILTLAVRPSARRRGAAMALLRRACSEARAMGAAAVFLEVAVDNDAARRLYETHGFVSVGARGGYYRAADGAPADALVLRRDLGGEAS